MLFICVFSLSTWLTQWLNEETNDVHFNFYSCTIYNICMCEKLQLNLSHTCAYLPSLCILFSCFAYTLRSLFKVSGCDRMVMVRSQLSMWSIGKRRWSLIQFSSRVRGNQKCRLHHAEHTEVWARYRSYYGRFTDRYDNWNLKSISKQQN